MGIVLVTPTPAAPGIEGNTPMLFHLTRSYTQGDLYCREYLATCGGEPVDRFSVFRERSGLGAWCAWTADTLSERRAQERRAFALKLNASE